MFNGMDATVIADDKDTPVDKPVDIVVGSADYTPPNESAILVGVGSVEADSGITVDDVTPPAVFRCLCLQTPYRDTLTADDTTLASAHKLYSRLRWNVRQWNMQAGAVDTFESVQGRRFEQDFRAAVNDDIALDVGLSIAQQVIDHDMQPGEKLRLLLAFDTVFGFEFKEVGSDASEPS